ncbi:MAG: polynucleotide adenylyltransferase PcnB [Venatoribacter sp.]
MLRNSNLKKWTSSRFCGFLFLQRLFFRPQSLHFAQLNLNLSAALIKSIPKKIRGLFKKDKKAKVDLQIISRDHHNISRSSISEAALKTLYRLHNAGFEAYLVGGGVRDTLLGLNPKDFDVATNATPEQVNKIFRNSRLIGRRFKLVHVVYGREIIEVATFRAPPSEEHSQKIAATGAEGMILRDNVYGNKDEDAMRRDFTINALYYNIADFSLHAYADGYEDLKKHQIKLIGDPETRYREDPVRMLRAVRFVAKLNFKLEAKTGQAIPELASLLQQIPAARLFEEVLKLFLYGKAHETLLLLREYKLFTALFPQTEAQMQANPQALVMAENTMRNTDERINSGKSVTPYFFLASLLWHSVQHKQQERINHGMPPMQALQRAADEALLSQIKSTAIPKRFSIPMREIWELQPRLAKTKSKKVLELLAHPRFRAAYDFLLLRAQSGEPVQELVKFWTKLQEKHPDLVSSRSFREPHFDDAANEHEPNKERRPRRRAPRKRKPFNPGKQG